MTRRLLILLSLLAVAVPTSAQSTLGTVMPVPRMQFLDNTGVPLSGGSLTTYTAGTTTPLATCATSSTVNSTTCTTALPNPITLDSAGRPQTGGSVETGVYLLPQTYKFVLKNSLGVTVYTQDNVSATLGPNAVALQGTFTFAAPTVLTIAGGVITPSQNVHGVDTSGGAANLNTIATTNVVQAFELFLYPNNAASNTVTVKNGAGNISLVNGGDFVMDAAGDWIVLMLRGSTWYEITRSKLLPPMTTGQLLYGVTGAYPVAKQAALMHANPANQTGNGTATFKMNGLGAAASACTITPLATGRVVFTVTGYATNDTNGDAVTFKLAYGTGTAPANAAAATGTVISATQVYSIPVAGAQFGFALQASVTGLALSTAVWFDLQIADVTGGIATVQAIDCNAQEL